MPNQGQPNIPFQLASRQRYQDVGVVAFTALGTNGQPLILPKVGLLSHLILQFVGTVNLSAAGASFADLGPWKLLSRIKLDSNQGAASIIDLDGWDAYLVNFLLERGYGADRFGAGGGPAGAGQLVPNPDIYNAPLASGNNNWVLTVVVPISGGFGQDYILGLINLQAPETQLTLTITFGNATDVTAGAPVFTVPGPASVNVGYLYYEVPPPGAVQMPPLTVIRLLSDAQPIITLGENLYTVVRQGTLLQMIQTMRINATRSDLIDFMQLKVNKTDSVYRIRRQMFKTLQRIWSGVDWPTGTFVWDFWHANGQVASGPARDAIDTQAVTTLESVPVVNSAAVLGVSNNFMNTCRRVYQRLA